MFLSLGWTLCCSELHFCSSGCLTWSQASYGHMTHSDPPHGSWCVAPPPEALMSPAAGGPHSPDSQCFCSLNLRHSHKWRRRLPTNTELWVWLVWPPLALNMPGCNATKAGFQTPLNKSAFSICEAAVMSSCCHTVGLDALIGCWQRGLADGDHRVITRGLKAFTSQQASVSFSSAAFDLFSQTVLLIYLNYSQAPSH